MPRSSGLPINLRALAANVPMYREYWEQSEFDPYSASLQWEHVPIIGKREFREAGVGGRVDARFTGPGNSTERTGGSSGEPLEILIDAGSRRRRQWRFLKALLAAGYRPGQRLWIISTHRSSKVNTLARWTYLDLRETEAALSRRYEREKPDVLYGPLRALLSMAQELPRGGRSHRPRALVATAELLRREDQSELRARFGIDAADFYGMTEVGLFAYRLPTDPHYRMVADEVLAEFLPTEEDPALERLVLTTLRDCAMPLVRYDTGDLVRRDHRLAWKPIVEFVGREIDGVMLASGKRISPYRITLALESLPGVRRYQVVQHEDRSVEIRLQTDGVDASAIQARACEVIAALLGPGLPVRAAQWMARGDGTAEKFRPVRSYAR